MNKIVLALLIVGGLNWLLVGVLQWDVGELFGGMDNVISRVIYILVGIAAIYKLFKFSANDRSGQGSNPTP